MRKELHPELIEAFKQGSVQALARLLTIIENQPEQCRHIFSALHPIVHQPIIIGFTGAPGVGKSTLVNELLRYFRESFAKIAVLAVDPSSGSSGGAFLGDRERMKQHAADDRIFIRSIATRGKLGGVSCEILDFLLLLSSFKFDLILIETVGTGQTEIDIATAADITTVILTPSFGDDLQVLKAGILEIADIFVINKNDLPGAERLSASLRLFGAKTAGSGIPILETLAVHGSGVAELAKQILTTHQSLREAGTIKKKRYHRFQCHVRQIIDRRFSPKLAEWAGLLYQDVDGVVVNPYACSDELYPKLATLHD